MRADAPPDGIPLAVKDLFDTAGLRTTYGSRIWREHVPERSAEAVLRLERAGYVVVGKTNLHEFAYGVTSENPHYGPVRNPLDPSRMAGGSSGGSAAALAAGMCDVALGSDTGGSIRIPAACCGVVGFKPSYGVVPTRGMFPLAPSFDHAGPLARTVGECAAAFVALAQRQPPAPAELPPRQGAPDRVGARAGTGVDLERLRVGVAEAFFRPCAAGVEAAVRAALRRLPDARPVAVEPPEAFDAAPIFLSEAAASHHATFPARRGEYGSDVAARLDRGLRVSLADCLARREALGRWRARAAAVFAQVDLLALPTIPCVAPPLGSLEVEVGGGRFEMRELLTRNTRPFNNLGWPALALPCGPAEDGLPASITLAGPPGADGLVLAAGEALESLLAERCDLPGLPRPAPSG